mgnify:CR=1 FL=1
MVHGLRTPAQRTTKGKGVVQSMVLRIIMMGVLAVSLSGCGSIISRTMPGQGHGNQYYPGVQWDLRDSAWRYVTVIDVPLSMIVDTFMLPIDARHGPYE